MNVIKVGFGTAAMRAVMRIGIKKLIAKAAPVLLPELLQQEQQPAAIAVVVAPAATAVTAARLATLQHHLEPKLQK